MTQQEQTSASQAVDPEWLEGFLGAGRGVGLARPRPGVRADDRRHRLQRLGLAEGMRGPADAREFLEFVWTGMPDTRFRAIEGPFLHPSEPKASFYWRGTADAHGPDRPARAGADRQARRVLRRRLPRVPRRQGRAADDRLRHGRPDAPARRAAAAGQPRGARDGEGLQSTRQAPGG